MQAQHTALRFGCVNLATAHSADVPGRSAMLTPCHEINVLKSTPCPAPAALRCWGSWAQASVAAGRAPRPPWAVPPPPILHPQVVVGAVRVWGRPAHSTHASLSPCTPAPAAWNFNDQELLGALCRPHARLALPSSARAPAGAQCPRPASCPTRSSTTTTSSAAPPLWPAGACSSLSEFGAIL